MPIQATNGVCTLTRPHSLSLSLPSASWIANSLAPLVGPQYTEVAIWWDAQVRNPIL